MTDRELETLNKAYLLGEYDLKRYRELREQRIDAFTGYYVETVETATAPLVTEVKKLVAEITQEVEVENDPTLQITAAKPPPTSEPEPAASSVQADKSHRGPSFLQFLWVSIAILLFIYMYTATID